MECDYLKEKKILLVDDEEQLREMVASILAQEGYARIRTAGTVKEALETAREWEPAAYSARVTAASAPEGRMVP